MTRIDRRRALSILLDAARSGDDARWNVQWHMPNLINLEEDFALLGDYAGKEAGRLNAPGRGKNTRPLDTRFGCSNALAHGRTHEQTCRQRRERRGYARDVSPSGGEPAPPDFPVARIGEDGKPNYDQEFFLALARRGKEVWNRWRAGNRNVEGQPYISVTFEGVDFREPANAVSRSSEPFSSAADCQEANPDIQRDYNY